MLCANAARRRMQPHALACHAAHVVQEGLTMPSTVDMHHSKQGRQCHAHTLCQPDHCTHSGCQHALNGPDRQCQLSSIVKNSHAF